MKCPNCDIEMNSTYEPYEKICPKCNFWYDQWTGFEVTFKEVDEDMLYTQIECPNCKGNCKFDFINEDGDDDYTLCHLCHWTGELYLRDGKTYRFMKDDKGEYRYLQIPHDELKHLVKDKQS